MEIGRESGQGGAESHTKTEVIDAVEVKSKDIHDGNDLREFRLTVDGVLGIPPSGYGDVKELITRPRQK